MRMRFLAWLKECLITWALVLVGFAAWVAFWIVWPFLSQFFPY